MYGYWERQMLFVVPGVV